MNIQKTDSVTLAFNQPTLSETYTSTPTSDQSDRQFDSDTTINRKLWQAISHQQGASAAIAVLSQRLMNCQENQSSLTKKIDELKLLRAKAQGEYDIVQAKFTEASRNKYAPKTMVSSNKRKKANAEYPRLKTDKTKKNEALIDVESKLLTAENEKSGNQILLNKLRNDLEVQKRHLSVYNSLINQLNKVVN